MNRRALIVAAPLALLAAPALASAKEEKTAVGQYVDLSPVALPIAVEGRLVNYVFAHVRLNLAPAANLMKAREKEPFFRDALVRAGHRTPFTNPKDYTVLDSAKLSGALMRDAAAIVGPGVVKSVVITSQTPKRRQGLPPPKSRV